MIDALAKVSLIFALSIVINACSSEPETFHENLAFLNLHSRIQVIANISTRKEVVPSHVLGVIKENDNFFFPRQVMHFIDCPDGSTLTITTDTFEIWYSDINSRIYGPYHIKDIQSMSENTEQKIRSMIDMKALKPKSLQCAHERSN